ncbi:MAG: hypothetical protein M1151_05915 [Candidatus Thermoplasmatota archaeon]|nr:hypothetical protein [Candidatus Thermoplasmatota archaeon]MCL5786184.1 hypothetical protein [Candidatus Thermoplasmatota archaeon]
MSQRLEECFAHLNDEESAAECVHCLKKHGETVIFSDKLGRLALGREMWDDSHAKDMESVSEILGITDRKTYEEADRKYNLTMY